MDPSSKLSDNSKPHMTKEKEINLKTVDSKIITYKHVELISKWIDKLKITDNLKNSYKFKLLFRGSHYTSYEKHIRETDSQFFVEECEVFQVA